MKLSRDFKEFIECLNEARVDYLVIGGYAVAHHGRPRYTKDIDIWLRISPENAGNLISALKAFGFESLGLKADDFLRPGVIVQLGYAPHRIDLLTSAEGLEFATAWETRCVAEVEGINVAFIGREQLLANKRAVGRPQDLADISGLDG